MMGASTLNGVKRETGPSFSRALDGGVGDWTSEAGSFVQKKKKKNELVTIERLPLIFRNDQ